MAIRPNRLLTSFAPQRGKHHQCMNVRCGWSGKFSPDRMACPRCKPDTLEVFDSEAQGWRAFNAKKESVA